MSPESFQNPKFCSDDEKNGIRMLAITLEQTMIETKTNDEKLQQF